MTNQTCGTTNYSAEPNCQPSGRASDRRKQRQMLLFRRWLSRRPAPRFVRHVG